MNTAAGFGLGNALDAVDAALVLHLAVNAVAVDLEDDFLVAAHFGLAGVDDLHLPPLAFGVTRVHPEEVGGKEAGFVAAGASADLDDDVFVVVGILGQQGHAKFFLDFEDPRLDFANFLFCHLGHVMVGGVGKLLGVGQFGLGLFVLPIAAHHVGELGVLFAERLHLLDVGGHGGGAHLLFQFVVNRFKFPQFGFKIHSDAASLFSLNFTSRASSRERMPTSTWSGEGSRVVRY